MKIVAAVVAFSILLCGCSGREVSLDGDYTYLSGGPARARLTIKGHKYTLCTKGHCSDGRWDYESPADHTRLVFQGPINAFTDDADWSSRQPGGGPKIGNADFGFGCPCLQFGDPDGDMFQKAWALPNLFNGG